MPRSTKKRDGPGRPTKLTPEVQKRICDAIRLGNYMETAAAYAGVTARVVRTWLTEGRKAESGLHREFVDAVDQAMAESEVRDVAFLAQCGDWKARAFKLARRFPERWGSKTEVQHTGSIDMRALVVDARELLESEPEIVARLSERYAQASLGSGE